MSRCYLSAREYRQGIPLVWPCQHSGVSGLLMIIYWTSLGFFIIIFVLGRLLCFLFLLPDSPGATSHSTIAAVGMIDFNY